jgi:hypothetical protein
MGEVRDILQIESGSFEGLFDITSSLSDCLIIDLLEKGLGLSVPVSLLWQREERSLLLIRHLDNGVDLAIIMAIISFNPS